MLARICTVLTLALLLAACDSSEHPGMIPAELEGTWARATTEWPDQAITFHLEDGVYRFEVREGGRVVTRGSFATVGVSDGAASFEIRYTVHTDESEIDVRPNERAEFDTEHTLILTPLTGGGTSRPYTRVE